MSVPRRAGPTSFAFAGGLCLRPVTEPNDATRMATTRAFGWLLLGVPALVAVACGGDKDDGRLGLGSGGSGAKAGSGSGATASGGKGSGATGGTSPFPVTGGSAGNSGQSASGGSGAKAGSGSGGGAGAEMCAGSEYEQKTASALDIYFVFDRTGSMGEDCDYVPGDEPPVDSKACYATYAFSDYLINVASTVDTRLALQFMSQPDDCDGSPYETPLVPLTKLPVPNDHAMIQAISNETFEGGLGTHIEGALRGIAAFTTAHREAGREMIGVLMTDGDPEGCEEGGSALRRIISDHLDATGIRTFIIGMEGATDDNLEALGNAGGAEPHDNYCGSVDAPCHYWNVGNGSSAALEDALKAIVEQAAPIPCEFKVSGFTPPAGQTLDFGKVNVTLSDAQGKPTTIGQVEDKAACPDDVPAWYYDNPASPSAIVLCTNACSLVTDAATGSRVSVRVGCEDTVVLPPVR